MKPTLAFVGVICCALTGCDLIDQATANRATTTQKRAAADMLVQAGTIASIADDPEGTTASDLVDALVMQHYVYLVSPEQKVTDAMNETQALPGPVPECIVSDGNGNITIVDCDVTLPGGRQCLVNGTLTVTSTSTSTTVVGTLSLAGGDADCLVQSWDDIDIVLDGPPDQPSNFMGQCDFAEEGDGNSYTGRLILEGVFIADGCDVPSGGRFEVRLNGMYNGVSVDGVFIGEFKDSPCGDLIIVEE